MAKPGIMLYFDILGPIQVLPDADKGKLLVAMLEYGQNGTEPKFDGMLALAWSFVKPKLDRDDKTYENSKTQRKYAAFCKKCTALNLPKVPFDKWLSMSEEEREQMIATDNGPLRAVDFVNGRYPTTTTTTTTTATTTATAAAAASITGPDGAAAAAEKGGVDAVGGILGKNVVFLSDEQVADLLDTMGIDAFDHYVDKLSNFILKNDAHVKNHYETILRWWEQDGSIRR